MRFAYEDSMRAAVAKSALRQTSKQRSLKSDAGSLTDPRRGKTSHGNAGVWKAWKAIKPAFHPSHTPWKSLRGFPHYHGYGDDYHVSEDRQRPPKTRNQSHSHRKGLVNHVPGLKRKGCPGTLKASSPPVSVTAATEMGRKAQTSCEHP